MVVRERSFMPGTEATSWRNSIMPFLTRGSPPVTLTLETPWLAERRTSLNISSYLNMFFDSASSMPSGGMQ